MPDIASFRLPAAAAPVRPGRVFLLAATWLVAGVYPALAQRPPVNAVAPAPFTEVPQGSPIPRILPAAPPGVSSGLPSIPPPAAGTAMPDVAVAISSVGVDGATAYPEPRLAEITAGLVGPATSLAQVEAARLALVNLYRTDGYVLTSVTASLGAGGRLRFVVTEGHIADVKLDGDIGPAGTMVLRFLHHLTEQSPINTATLERWLLLAQDIPGVTVRAVLRPSTEQPGALTLVAQVSRQAFSGLQTTDNRGFDRTGPIESLFVLDANSFTSFGEKTEVSLFHTEGGTQNFGQASTEAFVGDSGLRVRVYGGYGEALPSGFLRAVNYQGFTTVAGASAIYPLIRSRQETLNVSALFDIIESAVKVGGGPANRDGLRVARASADYAREDVLLGADRSAVNTALFRLSQGIPGLGGTRNGDPQAQRTHERVDFTKGLIDVSRTQTLFAPWAGASVGLKGRLVGQLSPDVLPPAEQFYLGGSELNRGYYSGQVTGDNALDGTLELQLNTSFDLTLFSYPVNVATQFYAFYDLGEVWQNQRSDRNFRLASEGVGLRTNITQYTEFDLEGVVRNTRLPITTPGQGGAPATVKALASDAIYWRVLTRF